MRKELRRRYNAHKRANVVCTEFSGIFDVHPGGQKLRLALGQHVTDVVSQNAAQNRYLNDRRAALADVHTGRQTLRAAAAAVVKVGKLVNLDEPTMSEMQLPGVMSDDDLVGYAKGLLESVGSNGSAFVDAGLPPDLLANLATAIDKFVAAKNALATARSQFTAATQATRDALDQADLTVDALSAIAVNTPDAPSDLLLRLRIAKRVGPRQQPAAKPAGNPAPTTATAPPADKTA